MKAPWEKKYITCPVCGGKGYIEEAQDEFTNPTECPLCHGEGDVEEDDYDYKEWCRSHYGFSRERD